MISIEKLSVANWKTDFSYPYTVKPSFSNEKFGFTIKFLKSHIFVTNLNLKVDGIFKLNQLLVI